MAKNGKSKKSWRIFVLADTHNRLPDSVSEMAKGRASKRGLA
jgi:hypothetical protein